MTIVRHCNVSDPEMEYWLDVTPTDATSRTLVEPERSSNPNARRIRSSKEGEEWGGETTLGGGWVEGVSIIISAGTSPDSLSSPETMIMGQHCSDSEEEEGNHWRRCQTNGG